MNLKTISARSIFFSCIALVTSTQADSFKSKLSALATSYIGTEKAGQIFQDFGQEAQSLVGIPTHEHVDIKVMSPDFYNDKEHQEWNACTQFGHIFINPKKLNNTVAQQEPGFARITLFHESKHKNQNLKAKKSSRWPQFNNYVVVDKEKYNHVEQEADLEAAKLGNCFCCSQEFARHRTSQTSTSELAHKQRADGYASKEEILAIAADQKARNARCKYHKN